MLGISLLFVSFCSKYNPALYPGYDVLNPNAEVQENPLSIVEVTEEGKVVIHQDAEVGPGLYFIVNKAFMMWVFELKEEVKRLKKHIRVPF